MVISCVRINAESHSPFRFAPIIMRYSLSEWKSKLTGEKCIHTVPYMCVFTCTRVALSKLHTHTHTYGNNDDHLT